MAVRIDKWLWVARLMKTRTDAADAVKGGRVRVNGETVKPSRDVRVDDRLDITKGTVRMSVVVRALAERRGPARDAALLYEETEESRMAREAQSAERRLARPPVKNLGGRPTKRDRRRYEQARGRR